MSFQRARAPEQKQVRRQAILEAAAASFEERGGLDISLAELAREAGMTKGNIYRYFESKEAIFLTLFAEDFERWTKQVSTQLLKLTKPASSEQLARLLGSTLTNAPRLCALIAQSGSVLERNLSFEALDEFKRRTLSVSSALVLALSPHMGEVNPSEAVGAMMRTYALVAGLWPMANLSPTMHQVLEQPELAPLRLDFEEALTRSIRDFIEGARTT